MSDWPNPWGGISTVTALPDAGAEFMIGDEDVVNDVINRTALELELEVQELAASGLGTNLIPNGSFERWPDGTANQAPEGYTKKGAPTDVSRDTGERDGFGGSFAAKITSNGAGNEGLTITLSNLKASTDYYVAVRAKVTAGDTARIWTTGGSSNLDETTTSTTFITVSGIFTTDATPTNIVLNFGSNTATDIVWFDKLMIQEGEVGAVFNPNDEVVTLRIVGDAPSIPEANVLYKDNIIGTWINFDGTGVIAITDSFNIFALTDDGGLGLYTITWDTDFADTKYCVLGLGGRTNATTIVTQNFAVKGVSSIQIRVTNDADVAVDANEVGILAIGAQ